MVNYTLRADIAFFLFPIFCYDNFKSSLLSGSDSLKYVNFHLQLQRIFFSFSRFVSFEFSSKFKLRLTA